MLDIVRSSPSAAILLELREIVEGMDDDAVLQSFEQRLEELRGADSRPQAAEAPAERDAEVSAQPEAVEVEAQSAATAGHPPEPKKMATMHAASRLPWTEFGNTQRMLRKFGDDLLFVEDVEQWFMWSDTYWKQVSRFHVQQLAQVTVNGMHWEAKCYADEERVKFLQWCIRSQGRRMILNMEELLKLEPRLRCTAEELDSQTHLLGTKNGAIDLRTGELVKPDRKARITTTTAVEYDPNAKCPVWLDTLKGVFLGNEQMIAYFQRLLGYTLMGNPKEDVLVIPFGSGSNGKSTTLGIVRTLLGGYARSAAAATFVDNDKGGGNAGGPREDILRLRGARFVYVSEPDENSELKEGLVKSMTGGDAMPARGVNAKRTIEVIPTWVPFIPTNHRPIIKGSDYAIWRRLMTIPFLAKFDKEKAATQGGADNDRKGKLMTELPGILAWMVQGALAYQKDGLGVPDEVRAAKEAYREDMDLLKNWLEDCCRVGPGEFATNEELWASWQDYAMKTGEFKFISSSRALGRRLSSGERFESASVTLCGRKQRGYKGLSVLTVSNAVDEGAMQLAERNAAGSTREEARLQRMQKLLETAES